MFQFSNTSQDHNWNIYKATLLSDIVVNVPEQHHCAAQEHAPVLFHISLLPDKAFLYVSKTLALTVRHTRTCTKTHTQRAFQRTSPLRWLENLYRNEAISSDILHITVIKRLTKALFEHWLFLCPPPTLSLSNSLIAFFKAYTMQNSSESREDRMRGCWQASVAGLSSCTVAFSWEKR